MTNDKERLMSMAEIAAQCDPERCIVRKCVGCATADLDAEECVRCYAELYQSHAKEQSRKDED